MSSSIALILRFSGDPDELVERFEQARKSWIEAQGKRYSPPIFFATCRAEDGVVLLAGWEAEEDHKAFRKQMMPYLHAAGLDRPTGHEQLGIARLGWDPVHAEAS
jgi:hypothetical protein